MEAKLPATLTKDQLRFLTVLSNVAILHVGFNPAIIMFRCAIMVFFLSVLLLRNIRIYIYDYGIGLKLW